MRDSFLLHPNGRLINLDLILKVLLLVLEAFLWRLVTLVHLLEVLLADPMVFLKTRDILHVVVCPLPLECRILGFHQIIKCKVVLLLNLVYHLLGVWLRVV